METITGAQIRFRSQDLRGRVSKSSQKITAYNLRVGRWSGCVPGPRRPGKPQTEPLIGNKTHIFELMVDFFVGHTVDAARVKFIRAQ